MKLSKEYKFIASLLICFVLFAVYETDWYAATIAALGLSVISAMELTRYKGDYYD